MCTKMDIMVDDDAIKELGAIMGSGGLVVLDENPWASRRAFDGEQDLGRSRRWH